ncbi:hypothetical protein D1007_27114 [Hordeum vulgare]|nr:hypothetical protein D1007_27114 [Hordeum vulgare]
MARTEQELRSWGHGHEKQKQLQRTPPREERKKTVDPDLADTTSSPSKNSPRDMQVDPSARKRLAMDSTDIEKEKEKLRSWSKETFGHVTYEIEKLRSELADLQTHDASKAAIRQKIFN